MLVSKIKEIRNGRVITKDESDPNQSDIEAAQRGNNMIGMSLADLEDLIRLMEGKSTFAAKVTILAAKQMIAAKKRAGARDSKVKDGEYFNGIHIGKGKILYEKGGYVIAQYGNGILLKSSKGASVAVATLEDGKRRIEKAIQAGGLYADSKIKDAVEVVETLQDKNGKWFKIKKAKDDVTGKAVFSVESAEGGLIGTELTLEGARKIVTKDSKTKDGVKARMPYKGWLIVVWDDGGVTLIDPYDNVVGWPEYHSVEEAKQGVDKSIATGMYDSKDAYEATKPKNIAAAKNLSVAQGKAASDRKTK